MPRVKIPTDQPIAVDGEWMLYLLSRPSSGDWSSLKLVRLGRHPKNAWRLGWNGARLAANRDGKLLEANNPDRVVWVVSKAKEAHHAA